MVAASGEGLALWSLVAQASFIVQLVMLSLLLASIVSWTIIFRKRFMIKSALAEAARFEKRFWSGGNINQIYAEMTHRDAEDAVGMAGIFLDGLHEFRRLGQQSGITNAEVIKGVQRAMRVSLTREIDDLEHHLPFLATVGSTSPYVGLFGTVWGIMNSFRSLGTVQQATIAHVAPGIAEALIATAMGLFAAIPAVIAYNRYSARVERLITRYEIFIDEFSSIVQRQATPIKAMVD